MTDSVLRFPTQPSDDSPALVPVFRDRDDSVLADLLGGGTLLADLSLERWLDRVERRGEWT